MVDPTTSATIVALSAIAFVILLNAVRKTIALGEWDSIAFFGAFSVLAVNFGNFLVTFWGEWTIKATSFPMEFLAPEWARSPIRLANVALAVASTAIFLRGVRRDTMFNPAAVLLLLMAITSILSAVLHGDNPIQRDALIFLAVLIACTVAPRGLGIHVGIGTCCMIVAIVNGLSIADHADFSVVPCTPSKCGVLGFLFRGIYSHENTLAMFLALAMPFVYIAFKSWEGPVLSAYLLGLVVVTGSRSGIAAAVVTLVVLILVRPDVRQRTWAPTRTGLLYLLLVVVSVVGLALPFLSDDPTVLSHRGQLWMLARNALADPATLLHGTGMLGWQQEVQQAGLLNYYSPHNQWLHILNSTGLIGLLLFVAAFAALIWQAGRKYNLVVGCVLLPVVIFSVTESPWPIDSTDILSWVVTGTLLSFPAVRRLSGDQIMAVPRRSGELMEDVAAIAGPNAIARPRPPGDDKKSRS